MTQEQALSILRAGASVFLTGEAGSGKTHVVNRYAAYLRRRGVPYAMTASTGIAATHIGGTTIHSWSGIGIRSEVDEEGFRNLMKNGASIARIRAASVLVIDEISMLDSRAFSLIERICRRARGGGSLPFGGLQVILVGDFFQLPPVSKGEEARFAFESSAWESLSPVVCYLTEQYRQEDPELLDILSAIRREEVSDTHRERLASRLLGPDDVPDDDLPLLFTHNRDVDRMNGDALSRLPGKAKVFRMMTRGAVGPLSALIRGCLSPEALELKEGASVMFTKNSPDRRYVNGTIGVVTGFDTETRYPVVRTGSGDSILVKPAEWMIEEGEDIVARIRQIPLRLAWSITIHKSQGVSLDAAVMDLSRVFEYGQGYVALSRVRTLSGLSLVGLSEKAFLIHPSVRERDRSFREASIAAERSYGSRVSEKIRSDEEAFLVRSRTNQAEERSGKKKSVSRKRKGKSAGHPTSLDGIGEKRSKAYSPWKKDEDKWLKRLVLGGADAKSIARILGRESGAIRSRIGKLGLGHKPFG